MGTKKWLLKNGHLPIFLFLARPFSSFWFHGHIAHRPSIFFLHPCSCFSKWVFFILDEVSAGGALFWTWTQWEDVQSLTLKYDGQLSYTIKLLIVCLDLILEHNSFTFKKFDVGILTTPFSPMIYFFLGRPKKKTWWPLSRALFLPIFCISLVTSQIHMWEKCKIIWRKTNMLFLWVFWFSECFCCKFVMMGMLWRQGVRS